MTAAELPRTALRCVGRGEVMDCVFCRVNEHSLLLTIEDQSPATICKRQRDHEHSGFARQQFLRDTRPFADEALRLTHDGYSGPGLVRLVFDGFRNARDVDRAAVVNMNVATEDDTRLLVPFKRSDAFCGLGCALALTWAAVSRIVVTAIRVFIGHSTPSIDPGCAWYHTTISALVAARTE